VLHHDHVVVLCIRQHISAYVSTRQQVV
jgi:hypothetical protein